MKEQQEWKNNKNERTVRMKEQQEWKNSKNERTARLWNHE